MGKDVVLIDNGVVVQSWQEIDLNSLLEKQPDINKTSLREVDSKTVVCGMLYADGIFTVPVIVPTPMPTDPIKDLLVRVAALEAKVL